MALPARHVVVMIHLIIILIGYSIGTGLVPFSYDDLESVLRYITRKAHLETNLKALEIGYEAGKL
jgi:Pyruvate/2-oxoacid:ferredoxin oxidoreductase gamma subunit